MNKRKIFSSLMFAVAAILTAFVIVDTINYLGVTNVFFGGRAMAYYNWEYMEEAGPSTLFYIMNKSFLPGDEVRFTWGIFGNIVYHGSLILYIPMMLMALGFMLVMILIPDSKNRVINILKCVGSGVALLMIVRRAAFHLDHKSFLAFFSWIHSFKFLSRKYYDMPYWPGFFTTFFINSARLIGDFFVGLLKYAAIAFFIGATVVAFKPTVKKERKEKALEAKPQPAGAQ